MKILSFGEVLWDIIGEEAHLGGAPLNFAAHSVLCGGQSSMLSRLGIDHERMTFRHQGRRYRLTDVHGHVVNDVLT